jgi:tyrosyl-tRNA synthetase
MEPQSILTMPLLVGTDGVRKMSKSFGNYVGVTDPPDEMFGRLMSVPDHALPEYYLLLLDEDLDPDRHPGQAKRELARRLVDRFHGAGAGADAERAFDRVHVNHAAPEEVAEAVVSAGGDGLVHLPAAIAGAFGVSRSEARRLIEQGGVRVADEVIDGDRLDLPAAELDGATLQLGRRRFRRLRVVEGG